MIEYPDEWVGSRVDLYRSQLQWAQDRYDRAVRLEQPCDQEAIDLDGAHIALAFALIDERNRKHKEPPFLPNWVA